MPQNNEKREDKKRRIERWCERACGNLFKNALEDPSVTEISLNDDGKLFIEHFGETPKYVGNISEVNANAILSLVADYHGRIIDAQNTILECEFPIDGSRFEGIFPPNVARAIFSLRKKATKVFPLSDYLEKGLINSSQKKTIEEAILNKKNILVIGGTSSGKTTFLNAIIDSMSTLCPEDRIITIEDTAELQVTTNNRVLLYTSASASMSDLGKAVLRLRPDRILVGEVRGAVALELITVWTTGHPGGTATIHADSAEKGLSKMSQYISQHPNAPRNIDPIVADAVNLAVFLKKDNDGKRRVKEIIQVDGYGFNEKTKIYEFQTTPLL